MIYYLLSIIYSPCAPTVLTRKAARTAAAATLGSGDAASILGILGSCGRCWSCKQRGHNLWLQRCLHLWVTVQERGSICTVPAAASISLMSHLHTTSAPEQPLVASVCSSQVGTVPAQSCHRHCRYISRVENNKMWEKHPSAPRLSQCPMVSAGVCQDDSRRKCPYLDI